MNRTTTFEQELERTGHLVFTNVGVSMMPLLRQGRDLMVIEKRGTSRLRKYDAVLFKRDNGQYVLHRIIAVRDKDYLIMGDNTFQKEYVDDAHILGILTQVVRGRHTISADNKHYQHFVRLWWACYPLRWLVFYTMCRAARLARWGRFFLKQDFCLQCFVPELQLEKLWRKSKDISAGKKLLRLQSI